MASAFSHAFVAWAIGQSWKATIRSWKFWGLSLFCSVVPDLDVIGFAWGIPYDHLLGHRGISHPLSFALIFSLAVVQLGFPYFSVGSGNWWKLITHFFLVTSSHGVLDAMTNGGLGVAFFAPFDHTRYFFPWTPVDVSPIGIWEFFGPWGARVLMSELIWIWVPVLLVGPGVGKIVRWVTKKSEVSERNPSFPEVEG